MVAHGGQRGVDLGLRARQRQCARTVGSGADGGAADQGDGERAIAHAELGGGQVAVHVIDGQAGDGQGQVFGGRLRSRHGVDGGVVDGTNVDIDGCVIYLTATIADGVVEGHRAIEVGVGFKAE